eukprot:4904711-Karenia_brevis.AAC.1
MDVKAHLMGRNVGSMNMPIALVDEKSGKKLIATDVIWKKRKADWIPARRLHMKTRPRQHPLFVK